MGNVWTMPVFSIYEEDDSTKYSERTHIFSLLTLFSQTAVFKDGEITPNIMTHPYLEKAPSLQK